jgi:hypothetical protein
MPSRRNVETTPTTDSSDNTGRLRSVRFKRLRRMQQAEISLRARSDNIVNCLVSIPWVFTVPTCFQMAQLVSRRLLVARRVSCFKTCLVNTSRQRILTRCFISSSNRFSPSWLIAVTCFISITSSPPSNPALATSHALRSSAAQGPMSLPSRTKRRWLARSMTEIFNMRLL